MGCGCSRSNDAVVSNPDQAPNNVAFNKSQPEQAPEQAPFQPPFQVIDQPKAAPEQQAAGESKEIEKLPPQGAIHDENEDLEQLNKEAIAGIPHQEVIIEKPISTPKTKSAAQNVSLFSKTILLIK